MSDLHRLGPQGEDYALDLLKRKGHRLLERNFRCPVGELDLITWHRDTLVFTEVRARNAEPGRHASESVTPGKQRRVVRAAQWYLGKRARQGPPPPCRFDVVWLAAQEGRIVDGGVIEGAFGA